MEIGLDDTKKLLSTTQLKPAIVGLPVEYRKENDDFERDMPKLDEAARFARAIGCPRMSTWIMSSSPVPKTDLRKVYLERLRSICQVLEKHHVRLAIEFLGPLHIRKLYPHEFIYRMDETLEFVKDIGPNAGLMLDSWHWYHAGRDGKGHIGCRKGTNRLRAGGRRAKPAAGSDQGQRAAHAWRRHHRLERCSSER